MRRRRRKPSQPGVSLFPFLAVLICTLGVLIVLLVLAVQSASTSADEVVTENTEADSQRVAQKAADAEVRQKLVQQQRERIEELQGALDLRDIQSEGLEEFRPELTKRLAAARDYRAHLENEILEIEEDAAQLAAELKLIDEKKSKSGSEVDNKKVADLRKQIADAKEKLSAKRNSVETIVQKKYSIVPYHGTGGTKRQPIFLECVDDAIVLQPYNIRLTRTDFFHPVQTGNPVDAALLTVRNYSMRHKLSKSDQRPYPLLVVRPDGAKTYGLARRAMNSWADEFGYELVGADRELDFGTVDPQLAKEIRIAVEQAKQKQRALVQRQQALKRARGLAGSFGEGGFQEGFDGDGGPGTQPGLRASSQRGGFVQTGFQSGQTTFGNNGSNGFSNSNERSSVSRIGDSLEGQQQATGRSGASQLSSGQTAASGSSSASANNQGQSGQGSAGNGTEQSLAKERGANWALPTQTIGATGYVRPVSVRCSATQLTLKDAAGKQVTIDFGSNPTQGIDRMINVLWQRIDSWGIAGANAFWKPALEVTVEADGEKRFRQLKSMLRGSGVTVQKEQP